MQFFIRMGLLSLALVFSFNVFAVETFSLQKNTHSTVALGEYQIFPEKRMGNAIYFQYNWLTSFPNRVILDVLPIPGTQSLVYLYADEEKKLAIGLHSIGENQQARIKRVDDEFYEVWVLSHGLRAIFRIYQNKLMRIAGHLRTATGVTPSHNHVAFYHIVNSELITKEEGKLERVYDFRIHIIKRTAEKPQRLDITIRNNEVRLQLSWVDAGILRYYLSDGTFEDLDVAKLLPDYF
ncbi:MAG: hypothetical protein HQM14_09720 [SAR324 cluster bacterium]|nr:hypothetical protein [SAR324 cluster bacterium]